MKMKVTERHRAVGLAAAVARIESEGGEAVAIVYVVPVPESRMGALRMATAEVAPSVLREAARALDAAADVLEGRK